MKVTREHGLVLNKKCEVKSNSVKFFECVYDKHRAHPDPSKVSAIKEMPAPQNKGQRRASELPWNGNISLTIHLTKKHSENTKKPVTIQVDASSKGLGATLI